MIRNLFVSLTAVALLGLMAGCSDNSASSTSDPYVEFGGYEPTSEPVAFDEPTMLAELTTDVAYNDDILTSPTVDTIINEAEDSGTYALRILWGSLEYDSTITAITDWSGSLTISRGAEIVRRVLCFEPGQDSVLPRTDRNIIEWISKTSVHRDGIFVNLYIPKVDSTDTNISLEPVTVSFVTGPFSITFNLDDLATLDTIYQLDDSVNSVAFRAIKIYPGACLKGFLEGRWGVDSTGQGIFYGHWTTQHGDLTGHVRGHWGVDPDGNPTNVFYGKWIDLSGNFEGFLRGTYKPRADLGSDSGNSMAPCVGGGWIKGQIFNASRTEIGVMRGHYKMPREDRYDNLGFFAARWKVHCPEYRWENRDRDGIEI